MAVGHPDAADGSEGSVPNLIAKEQENRIAAPEISGLEQQPGLFDLIGHFQSVLCREAERFFNEQMFFRLHRLPHQLFMQLCLRTDDDRFHGGVLPDLLIGRAARRIQEPCVGFRPFRIGIPDSDHVKEFRPFRQHLHKRRCMNMGAADQCDFRFHLHTILLFFYRIRNRGKGVAVFRLMYHLREILQEVRETIFQKLPADPEKGSIASWRTEMPRRMASQAFSPAPSPILRQSPVTR